MKKSLCTVGTLLIATSSAHALSITPTNDASALAGTLFLNQPSLIINNVSLSSAAQDPFAADSGFQAGTYTNFAGTYGLPNSGIALSSGNVSDFGTGPNTETGFTTGYNVAATPDQDAVLQPITGLTDHFDVVQLDIDFFVNANVSDVTFFATFGSDEFPEFVGGTVTDGFGLLVNGTNVASAVPTGGGTPLAVNIDHPDMTAIGGTELDGILAPNGNPILRFDVPVNAGELNNFSIILADTGDDEVDSTVYLSSFFSEPTIDGSSEFAPLLPSNPPDPVTGEFIIDLPEVPEGEVIWVDPPVTVGYVYEVSGDAEVASVTAPSLATVPDLDGYIITVGDASATIAAGATLDFLATFGTTASVFELSGINPNLSLDPLDPAAFPLGLSFTADVDEGTQVSITPSVEPIPLPAAGVLYGVGVLGAAIAVRRRRKAV